MNFKQKSKTIVPALLLIVTTAFYYIPSLVYFPNRDDFDNYFINLLSPILVYVVVAAVAIWFILALLPKRVLKYITSILIVTGLLLWFQGDFFAVSYGALDGTAFDFTHFSQRGWYELSVLSFVILLALVLHKSINKHFPFIAILIALGQFLLVTYNVVTEVKDKEMVQDIDPEFYNFSSKKNIIIIVLDTFGADYFEAIRRENPEIVDHYNGFVNYTDAISNYPATKGSIPSMLTGMMIPSENPYSSFLKNEIVEFGLPTLFEKKGYIVSVISVYRWFKNFYEKRYIYLPPIDPEVMNQYSGYRLLDLALFRMFPHVLKPYIYKDGSWIFSGGLASQTEIPNMLPEKGERILQTMIKKAKLADDDHERFKIIHVSFPHPQLIFDKDCNRVSGEGDSVELMIEQSSCALKRLNELLAKFKEMGIYDSSLIAVFSDHGSRIVTDKSIHGFPSYFEMESSRVLFMLKGIGQTDEFSDVDNPVSLISLYDMFLDESQHTSKIDYLEDNNRLFFAFRNRDGNGGPYLPDSPLYRVGANAENPENWELLKLVTHDCPIEKIPMTVNITEDGREKYCAKFGFANPRSNGSGAWTESNDVRMIYKFDLSDKSDEDLEMIVNLRPFINQRKKELEVEWYVNNELIHSEMFDDKKKTKTTLKIPMELVKSKELTELQIKLSDLASPKNLGIKLDSRKLGLFIYSIEIK